MYNPLLFSPNTMITAVIDNPCDACQVQIPVTRQTAPSGVCDSYGDPHYNTLNGIATTYQGLGVFYLIKTPYLVVQASQTLCNPALSDGPTCNSGVAIRYS